MATPIRFPNNSPLESSHEELSDSEVSYSSEEDSMEDKQSDSENTNGGSRSFLSNLKREETERDGEFWVKYPYLKKLTGIIIAQGLSENYAYERVKLIGDEKAKEFNEKGKALFIEELEFCKKKLELLSFVLSIFKSSI